MKTHKILIVEDDLNAKKQLKWAFSDKYKVFMAEDKKSSLSIFKNENPVWNNLKIEKLPEKEK